MSSYFEYTCRHCNDVHRGLPAWHFDAPGQALAIPRTEWPTRVALTEDDCVIDGNDYYLKGLLEIPVHDSPEPMVWGVWLSVNEASYKRFAELFQDVRREAGEILLGWLCNDVPDYPNTGMLKTKLHVREYPMRPWVELQPTDHPLAVDQRNGMSRERVMVMVGNLLHGAR